MTTDNQLEFRAEDIVENAREDIGVRPHRDAADDQGIFEQIGKRPHFLVVPGDTKAGRRVHGADPIEFGGLIENVLRAIDRQGRNRATVDHGEYRAVLGRLVVKPVGTCVEHVTQFATLLADNGQHFVTCCHMFVT